MKKSKILIVYTGGTIGMINDPISGELKAFDFQHLYGQIPELNRIDAHLNAISFDQPIDSSEMDPEDWKKMAQIVFDNYQDYDGFVILHGTDTMAYSASALSFMLLGLSKPVIFTGSQLPIGTLRTDGKENLITAIEIAAAKNNDGSAKIQEVAVYFEFSLFRGNRCSKVSASEFDAFESPNFPKLVTAGVELKFEHIAAELDESKLTLFTSFNLKIAVVKIYPGINTEIYESIFDVNKAKIVIIESYGAGNIPSKSSLIEILEKFAKNGGIVFNTTQCNTGRVQHGKYTTSSVFTKIGAISGADITPEAAIAKSMYVLGRYTNQDEIKKELLRNIAGEISE